MTDPLDTDYLIAFALDQQAAGLRASYTTCPSCPHPLHGLPCAERGNGCPCETSYREEAS